MELIIAFVIKFIGVIYGTLYGLISSVPFVKEWIAVSKVNVVARAGRIDIVNTGHGMLVVVDGQAIWAAGTTQVPRRVLRNAQEVNITTEAQGDVHVWLKIVDVGSGKELTVTKQLTVKTEVV